MSMEEGSEKHVSNGDNQGQAIISIAISLKRIADTIAGDNQRYGLADCLDAWHREMVK